MVHALQDAQEQQPNTETEITAVIVLAAGAGTRMKSSIPKVLHPIAGRPLVWHALRSAANLAPKHLVAVLGHGRDEVGEFISSATDLPAVTIAVQAEQHGTGHAVACALEVTGPLPGTVIVSYGDVPLLATDTMRALAAQHRSANNAVTVLTARVPDPTGYGRIVRDAAGAVSAIVEHKDADAEQLRITEINSGVYAFDGDLLAAALPRLTAGNAQGEQYLTDVVGVARSEGHTVGTMLARDPVEIEGVNDRVQLAALARELNNRLVRRAQLAGVTVLDPQTTWLHADVAIGSDTVLLPGTSLEAGTSVGSGCRVGPDTTLVDCQVADGAEIVRSHCSGATIGPGSTVGPFTYLRPGTELAAGAKVGAYVEIKKSAIGEGAKVPHLAYMGDATIGAGTNVGAGTITANYDGDNKFPTSVGRDAFIGTNSTLVAPVTIGDGAYVAAGSVVTDDVAPGELAVARGRMHLSPGWVLRRRPGSAGDSSARAAGAKDRRPTGEESAG